MLPPDEGVRRRRSVSPPRPASVGRTITPAQSPTPPARVEPHERLALGALSWGMDPATKRPWTPVGLREAMAASPALTRDVEAMLKRAARTVGKPFPAIKALHSEGLLASDPRKLETRKTLKRLDDVPAWAFAARFAPEPLRAQAKQQVTAALLDWARTYEPTGNPINENRLVPLLQAADLALPVMTTAEQQKVRGWVQDLLETSEQVTLPGLCDINNWRTFNLQIRAAAAAVLGDRGATTRVSKALDALLAKTIDANGASFDFKHRDSFHYHLYNQQALLGLALNTPQAVSPEARRRIEKAVDFIKPYYLGRKTHLEFQNTQVQFDLARRAAGEPTYQVHEWDPKDADPVLQLARALFPGVRSWTEGSEAKRFGERQALVASLRWPERP